MNRFTATALSMIVAGSLVFSAILVAQVPATRLDGMVQSSSGAPISGARVTAAQDQTGRKVHVQSDGTGRFVFPALPPGRYTVSVEADGFRPIVRANVRLGSAGAIQERFTLLSGGSNQGMADEATNERLRALDAENSGIMLRREIELLPQLDRSPINLSIFQPGAQIDAGDPSFSRVNGTRQGSNNVMLDGVEVNDPVNPRLGLSMTAVNTDSIEQFTVVTNLGQAEYGRNAGAQVSLITRSGGNSWHGNAFEYFRNKGLNAGEFFSNSANLEKPRFTQSIFGASLGGPIIKDRTFIFGNFQGRRTTADITRNRVVLTSTAKTGLFQWIPPGSSSANTFDIVKNDPRRLGINSNIAAILGKLPDPNNSMIGDGLNTAGYLFNNPNNSDGDQATLRADHSISTNQWFFARFSWERSKAIDSTNGADASYPGQAAGTDKERHWGLSTGSDWFLSPRTVNQLRVGYLSGKVTLNRPARVAGPMLLANSWTNPLDPSFGLWHDSPVLEVTDNLSRIRGNHALKAGITFRSTTQKTQNDAGVYPNVSFGLGNGNAPPTSVGPSKGALSEADRQTFEKLYNDLLGRMEQVTQSFNSNLQAYLPAGTGRTREFLFKDYAFFLQDDWKVRENLTLNLGVRYELNGVPSESNGILGALDKASGISSSANLANFTIQRDQEWYSRDATNIGPRAGFAWAPRNSAKLVVRGGYGIFFDRLAGATASFVDSLTPASSTTASVFPNLGGKDLRLSDGIPALSPGTFTLTPPDTRSASAALFKSDLRTPRVQHFNLMMEREIFRNLIVEGGFVGERGSRLFTNLNLNQLKIDGGFLTAFKEIQSLRTYGTPVPSGNTLVKIFGSPGAAITAIGGSVLDQGLAGLGADIVDRNYFGRYAAAGVSDFYLRNFPQFDQFIVGSDEGSASYDSVQIRVRYDRGPLKAYGNYTRSKSLDDLSAECNGCTFSLNSFSPQREKALSDFDHRHAISGWLTYALPFGKDQLIFGDASKLANAIFGNWEMSLLSIWQTGSHFSVTSGRQTARAGVNSLADYSGSRQIGEIQRTSDAVFYFTAEQIKAFAFPAAGETGTSGRNSFTGPNYFNVDVSLAKSLRLGGERRVSFRAEAYNVLNRTNFGIPANNLSDSATFGKFISTQGHPRVLQAVLRFDF